MALKILESNICSNKFLLLLFIKRYEYLCFSVIVLNRQSKPFIFVNNLLVIAVNIDVTEFKVRVYYKNKAAMFVSITV